MHELYGIFFFFKQKTAYEMRISDWSSDVCSSDLRTARCSAGLCLDTGRTHRGATRAGGSSSHAGAPGSGGERSGLGTMNQLLSRNGDHLPLGPAVFHARLRAQDAYVEPDQTRALPAVPDPTGGTTPLFLASASARRDARPPAASPLDIRRC